MLWQHHTAEHQRQLAAELTAAARQGITALMSIDPEHAKRDVQRMLDASTGEIVGSLSLAPLSLPSPTGGEGSGVGSSFTT